MPVLISAQEQFLDFYARELQIPRNQLSDKDLRLGLALYHSVYLPVAVLIERRLNELDTLDAYQKFGFEPNVPSFAEATLTVTVPAAPTASPLRLPAGFIAVQNGLRYIATDDLIIAVGEVSGQVLVRAQAIGEVGTPEQGAAHITTSVGWLRRAQVTLSGIVPGTDGDEQEEIQRQFSAFAANPNALVQARDHEVYTLENYEGLGRVLAAPRTRVTFENSVYTKDQPIAGHLTVAVVNEDSTRTGATQRREIKDLLMEATIPYGEAHLHIVPIAIRQLGGSVRVRLTPGAGETVVVKEIVSVLNAYLHWSTWPRERNPHYGELWQQVSAVNGVAFVEDVILQGRLLDGSPSTKVLELEPWELPNGGFTDSDIEVLT